MRSTPSAPTPEARVGRCTLRGASDAIQPLKRRESARKARAAARETVMAMSDEMSERSRRARSKHELPIWPGVGEAGQRLANLDSLKTFGAAP